MNQILVGSVPFFPWCARAKSRPSGLESCSPAHHPASRISATFAWPRLSRNFFVEPQSPSLAAGCICPPILQLQLVRVGRPSPRVPQRLEEKNVQLQMGAATPWYGGGTIAPGWASAVGLDTKLGAFLDGFASLASLSNNRSSIIIHKFGFLFLHSDSFSLPQQMVFSKRRRINTARLGQNVTRGPC
jgi:hypothetical protein